MILDLFRLDGKVAVISAAGRGIGARTATAFAEVGADVVIGARSADQLVEVAAQVEALGRKAIVVAGDLGSRDGMASLVDAAISERHMAQDLSPKIRVNSISPGSIMTSALDMVLKMPEIERAMIDATPLGRLGVVDDIAAAAVYLASPAGAYVTGRDIRVDGGIEDSNLEMPIPDL